MKKEEAKELLYMMLLIRRFEEKAAQMYAMGKIGGFCHLYIGQEAVAAGAIPILREDDYVISHYRDHGHALARGCDPRLLMAELFGKATGICKGKGGSMHIFDVARRFMGGYAIVGGHLPIATGLGYSINYLGGDQVVLCIFGDGAVNEGAFHESLNAAALWKLPIIYLCENNLYGMGTPVKKASAISEIYERACSYALPRTQVDGMDLLKVRSVMKGVVKRCREDKVSWFVEARTYRFKGHSMSDPARYRTKEEVKTMQEKDPIANFRAKLLKDGTISKADAEELDDRAKQEVQKAVEFAEGSPFPSPESLRDDIYA